MVLVSASTPQSRNGNSRDHFGAAMSECSRANDCSSCVWLTLATGQAKWVHI